VNASWPDGAYAPHDPQLGPLVTVRFPDGGQADFLAGGSRPGSTRVRYNALDVDGLLVDVSADVDPDGKIWASWLWKTGVAGVDGGADVPAGVRDKITALCRRRAREARQALRVTAGTTRNPR
jgi:hypothetical protein